MAPDGRDVDWRLLAADDADAVYELHMAAIGHVGRPDLIRPETPEFFRNILGGGGRILGVSDELGLLAYGVLQWDLPPAEDLRPLFGLPPEAPFAKLAGAAVRPAAWGRGLQESAIAARLRLAASLGLTHLYATSAPSNWRSWGNLLNQGLSVRALIEQYGGALRYILYRDLGRETGAAEQTGIWLDTADLQSQRRILEDGHEGCAWRRLADGRFEMFYRTSNG